jgi:predicted kinase
MSSSPSAENNPIPPAHTAPQRVALAIGLPACGKSTWFRQQGIIPLASDELRILLADDVNEQRYQARIFETLLHLLHVRLDLGRPVSYIDATNLVREQRKPFVDVAKQRGCRLEAIFFDVPLDICLARNAARERQVPEDVMRRMAAALEPPTPEEGFARIVTVGADGQTLSDTAASHREAQP